MDINTPAWKVKRRIKDIEKEFKSPDPKSLRTLSSLKFELNELYKLRKKQKSHVAPTPLKKNIAKGF